MFLKNVLPEFAMHTEWRAYGPGGTFSIPLCFTEPNNDISSNGTLTPKKVQMIIDGLKGTQLSLNMSDENGTSPPVGEPRPSGYNSKSSHVARQRATASSARPQKLNTEGLKLEAESQDSDSDDSVDRGIEEAIQEYLKEKGDPKQSAKQSSSSLPMSKQLRTNCPPSDMPKYSDSNKILTATNYVPKTLKAGYSISEERKLLPKEKCDAIGPAFTITDVSKAQSPKNTADTGVQCKNVPCPLSTKEDEAPESSSDDGIEEAIWHFQMEKKKHGDSKNSSKVFQAKEDSDSSSDDGIEEAIRHFQMEKQKEQCESTTKAFRPCQPKPAQGGKSAAINLCHSGSHPVKKQKVSPKRKRNEKFSKPAVQLAVPPGHSVNSPLDNSDATGNEVSLSKGKPLLPIQTTLKVNTTAELMCAEAILDISKAVMPRTYDHITSFSNTCIQPSPLPTEHHPTWSDNKSANSSVDSDDGIEQEIRKFLESKAQMHKQQTVEDRREEGQVADVLQQKVSPPQNKKLKPPSSRKRKRKEGNAKAGRGGGIDHTIKDVVPLTEYDRLLSSQASGSTSEASVTTDVTTVATMKNPVQKYSSPSQYSITGTGCNEGILQLCSVKNETSDCEWAGKRGPSGDKSSSLDSDEDLDAAIKDLLRTKKRLKKKARDKRLKSRKREGVGVSELCPKEGPETKKILVENKSDSNPKTFKSSAFKNCNDISQHASSGKHKLNKVNSKPQKLHKKVKLFGLVGKTGDVKAGDAEGQVGVEKLSGGATQVADDSSSVDSDDSIEQEIRRFLAEKAKVSTVMGNAEKVMDDAVSATAPVTARSGEMGAQQAEVSPSGESPCSDVTRRLGPEQHKHGDGEVLRTSPPDICSMSSKGHQVGRAKDGVKTQSTSSSSEEDSSVQGSRLDPEKCRANLNERRFTPKANVGHTDGLMPSTATEVFQSQNLFRYGLLSLRRDDDVSVTSKGNLHSVLSRCPDSSRACAEEASSSACPPVGGCEDRGPQKETSSCPFYPEAALTGGPQFSKPGPACLPDWYHKQDPVSDGCWIQTGTGFLSEQAPCTSKESGSFPEQAARCGVDESECESHDERTNASQQSDQRSQHPRL